MYPHKFKTISGPIAVRHGLSSETTEKVARVFFREVQLRLSALDHTGVDVPGLGVFTLKAARASRKVLKINGLLQKIEQQDSVRNALIRVEQTTELTSLNRVLGQYALEQARKITIRSSRYDNLDTSLAKPGTDS